MISCGYQPDWSYHNSWTVLYLIIRISSLKRKRKKTLKGLFESFYKYHIFFKTLLRCNVCISFTMRLVCFFFVSAKQNCSVRHGAEGEKLFAVTSEWLQEMALRYEYKHKGTNGKHRLLHPQINQALGVIEKYSCKVEFFDLFYFHAFFFVSSLTWMASERESFASPLGEDWWESCKHGWDESQEGECISGSEVDNLTGYNKLPLEFTLPPLLPFSLISFYPFSWR